MPMRSLSLPILLTAVLAGCVVLTAMAFVDEPNSDSRRLKSAVAEGNFPHLVASPSYWEMFPSVPPPHRLWNAKTFFFLTPYLASAVYYVRFRLRRSFMLAGLACLLPALGPYLGGLIVVMGNDKFDPAVPWLMMMLRSVLYALVACAACAVVELSLAVSKWVLAVRWRLADLRAKARELRLHARQS